MARSTTITGAVVALTADPYDFVDKGDGRRVTGTTRRLWLVEAFSEAPTEVRVSDEMWPDVAGALSQFDQVECTTHPVVKSGKQCYQLDGFQHALDLADA